jgi:malonyl-CoA O-methyltransferase
MSLYNRQHVRRHFSKAAERYDEAAVLQKLTAQELDQRLDLIKLEVNNLVDLGAGTGFLTEKLHARYPNARLCAIDLSDAMLQRARQRLNHQAWWLKIKALFTPKKLHFMQADAYSLPLADGSQDLVITNFMLQWCDDLDAVLAEIRRVLRPEGLLMLSSLGPDTLKELRQAWVEVEGDAGHDRLNQFVDMHDLGDALIRAGFGQPVMDVEHYTLTYDQPIGVLRDLKAIGATNAHNQRGHSLLGKHKFSQMLKAYDKLRKDGKIPATFEVVHGHAWAAPELIKGPNRNKTGVHEITLDQFQNLVKTEK